MFAAKHCQINLFFVRIFVLAAMSINDIVNFRNLKFLLTGLNLRGMFLLAGFEFDYQISNNINFSINTIGERSIELMKTYTMRKLYRHSFFFSHQVFFSCLLNIGTIPMAGVFFFSSKSLFCISPRHAYTIFNHLYF